MRALSLAIACAIVFAAPAVAQDMPGMPAQPPKPQPQTQAQPVQPKPQPADQGSMAGMDMSGSHGGDMSGMDMSHMDMSRRGAMTGALGGYPMTREASGTSWQPDASPHDMRMTGAGDWSLMAHATFDLVYDTQSGPRGGDKTFLAGMAMFAARRDFGNDNTLNLRAMLSPDPLMGRDGYPLLLQTGETADGKTPLIDRQHPHDLVMELSASWAHRWSSDDSAFLYLGYPGEPAFGPPAFMHRTSGMDDPAAPITHHWLDSTHITFGVATAGYVHGDWKVEASSFTGREPDQNRFDFDRPRFDSASARVSWNPDPHWALQASWAHLVSPEELDPSVNETRFSGSAIYTQKFGRDGWWSTTAAFGRKQLSDGINLDGWLLESAAKPKLAWTVFARAEQVQSDELAIVAGLHGPIVRVREATLGAIHDWRLGAHESVGVGASYSFDFVPAKLSDAYGSTPHGTLVFLRFKLD
ncbi:MAG TPA: hypothetical protein VG407_06590 [Caulobacteraceae bacterium]|jgi:hypothetical protein|nr:hypothetical protein [Caulobacteraceae bacterium]